MASEINKKSHPDRRRNTFRINSSLRQSSWKVSNDIYSSFVYAAQGIWHSFVCQMNFRIHVLFAFITFTLGLWLRLSSLNLSILTLTISSVLVLELLNSSIEAVVDLAIGRRFHPLARIAKDCAAGAVLISSISALIVAVLLLLPAILIRFGFQVP